MNKMIFEQTISPNTHEPIKSKIRIIKINTFFDKLLAFLISDKFEDNATSFSY